MTLWGFVCGMFAGTFAGVVIMCILAMARED